MLESWARARVGFLGAVRSGSAGKQSVERTRRKTAQATSIDSAARARVGDAYERHASHVAAYALRRASSSDAADIVAETFLVAWRRHEAMPPEPDTLPWLYGVARRVLANQRRSTRRRGRLRDRLEAEFVPRQVDQPPLEKVDEFRRVARALHQLSDDDAELLRLVTWEGLTPAQIATTLDIIPGTARQRISRARQRLRAQLAADGADPDRHNRSAVTTPASYFTPTDRRG